MLKKRYFRGIFLLLVVSLWIAPLVSATHFDITYTSPLNFTTGLNPSGLFDYTYNLTFNLTNTSQLSPDVLDGYNITNITIFAILPNGTEVELARNNTENDFLVADYSVGFTYQFDRLLVINASILPGGQGGTSNEEGNIPLNITVEAYNGTNTTVVFNESVTFLSYAIFVDATPPDVTIKFLDRSDNEKTQFEATDTVKIVCTRSSATANSDVATSLVSSFNETNMSIQTAGAGSFDSIGSDEARATGGRDFIIEFTDTRELGDYAVACYSIDDYGLINDTVNTTFTIVKKPPRGASPFVNPDFKPPVATILVGAGSVSSLGTLFEEGASRLMVKTGAVSFVLEETTYTITVKDTADKSATYTVGEGTSFDVSVNAAETKNVDVSGDGRDDISITLHQVFNKKADTTFKLLTVQGAPQPQPGEQKEETKQPVTAKQKIPSGWGLVIFIFLVVIVVLAALHYFSGRQRRRGGESPAVRFTAKDLGLQRPPGEPGTFTRY